MKQALPSAATIDESIPVRYLSLDVLRGLTIALMVVVNNPGTWGAIYAPFEHAGWHGFTITDIGISFISLCCWKCHEFQRA